MHTSYSLKIPAKDGFLLAATLHTKQQPTTKGIIIINEGTAIPQKLYLPYANFLAEQGYDVVTYDYRGIGDSKPKSLKNFEASIIDWAKLDITGVINWVNHHYPKHPKYIIAHSMGGQILGLVENIRHISKIVTIASSYGNWHNFTRKFKYQAIIMWGFLIPVFTRIYGYFPANKLGLGADWPKGVAQNWFDWCIGNKPLTKLLNEAGIIHHFSDFHIPMKSFLLADDIMATPKVIPLFKQDFASTNLNIEIIIDYN